MSPETVRTYLSSSPLLHILVDTALPVGAEGPCGADAAHGIADNLVVQRRTGLIALVTHRTVSANAEVSRFLRRVDIGTQEEKLLAVFFFLSLDHAAHRLVVVAAAGVFVTVGGDDEHRLFRHVLAAGVLVDVADVVDGPAHSVQQGRAAAGEILLLGHGRHLFQRQAVMNDHALVVEQHRGDQRLACFPLLLVNHGVEAADGVRLQPRHGAAAIQDKNQFCHNENPPSFVYALIVAQSKEGLVACGATFNYLMNEQFQYFLGECLNICVI